MPKTKTNPNPQPPHPHRVPMAMVLMIAIVFILTIALLFVWNLFPHTPAYVPPVISPSSTIPTVSALPDATSTPAKPDCGTHGHWNGTVCLCGGIAGWSCPVDQECGDMKPTPTTPDAMGSCHMKPVTVREAPAGMVCDATNSICVDTTFARDTLATPFVVNGTLLSSQDKLHWELHDGNEALLLDGYATASATTSGQPANFMLRPFLTVVPATATGTLVVHEHAADGAMEHPVSIPVKFSTQTTTVKSICDGGNGSVKIMKTALPVEGSLNFMLLTDWNAEPQLESLNLDAGILTVKISDVARNEDGMARRNACIEATAKQFPSVKTVNIVDVTSTN